MPATHEFPLVVLSVVIAVISSYTALDLAGRVTLTQGHARHLWLVGGAIAMRIGIWSMHFMRISAETETKVELRQANEQLRGEIIERQWAEEKVRFLQTITQAISESTDFHSALGVALQKVCDFTGWNFGEAWTPRPNGTTLEFELSPG